MRFLPNPLFSVAVLGAVFGGSPFAHSQESLIREYKLEALRQPVAIIPYGQTVELKDVAGSKLEIAPWMSSLKDEDLISRISIPATHDAGTALGRTGNTRCQIATIPAQLAFGVRGFDIRLRLVDRELLVYHGEESQSLKFQAIMETFKKFLESNPREFLVMRVREEAKAIRPAESFEAAFMRFSQSKQFGNLFYVAKGRTGIPTVGESRGKIVLLDNYGKLPSAIDYPNPTMNVQDDYDTSDMNKKFGEIVANFEDAIHEQGRNHWNINYTSSSTLTVDQLASSEANNAKINDYLTRRHGTLGLVFMNFSGCELIRKIVESNF